ncbi:RC1041 family protein [Candidatus Tisiphia endosymbiont of Ceraclea dissimilis]|uniref:RC1041 family protein n=1 Tax=Candidatus Tisiphia endosymbiont of Ceraclea dissimilis TaxID=3077928 RepID=UPI003CCAD0A2
MLENSSEQDNSVQDDVWRNELGETYEEQEDRLDREESIRKRNAIIFVFIPMLIGFLIFTHFFLNYIEEKNKLARQQQSTIINSSQDTKKENN